MAEVKSMAEDPNKLDHSFEISSGLWGTTFLPKINAT